LKNNKRTLALHRETLQILDQTALRQAQGGLMVEQQQRTIIVTCFCPEG
jgi:hypothetical protein